MVLGLRIKPKKNAAAFWYNVNVNDVEDPLTLHGGDPVVSGEKFAINVCFPLFMCIKGTKL